MISLRRSYVLTLIPDIIKRFNTKYIRWVLLNLRTLFTCISRVCWPKVDMQFLFQFYLFYFIFVNFFYFLIFLFFLFCCFFFIILFSLFSFSIFSENVFFFNPFFSFHFISFFEKNPNENHVAES